LYDLLSVVDSGGDMLHATMGALMIFLFDTAEAHAFSPNSCRPKSAQQSGDDNSEDVVAREAGVGGRAPQGGVVSAVESVATAQSEGTRFHIISGCGGEASALHSVGSSSAG
jgi:hypothetical protein